MMVKIIMDNEKHEIEGKGSLPEVTAELLCAVQILYNKMLPGSEAAIGFKAMMRRGMQDESPVWNKIEGVEPGTIVTIVNPLRKGGIKNE